MFEQFRVDYPVFLPARAGVFHSNTAEMQLKRAPFSGTNASDLDACASRRGCSDLFAFKPVIPRTIFRDYPPLYTQLFNAIS